MTKTFTAGDYIRVDNADIFLAALAANANVPATQTITTTANAALSNNPANIAVQALTQPLWEGQLLKFDSIEVRVSGDVAASATAIPVDKVPSAIASGATATPYVVFPLYAVRSTNYQISEQAETFTTFNSIRGSTEEIVLSRTRQFSCEAMTVKGNAGLAILNTAANGIGKSAQVYFELLFDDGSGFKGFANVKNFRKRLEVQQTIMIQWDFGVSGALTEF